MVSEEFYMIRPTHFSCPNSWHFLFLLLFLYCLLLQIMVKSNLLNWLFAIAFYMCLSLKTRPQYFVRTSSKLDRIFQERIRCDYYAENYIILKLICSELRMLSLSLISLIKHYYHFDENFKFFYYAWYETKKFNY